MSFTRNKSEKLSYCFFALLLALAPVPPRPLHHKSADGRMPPAYLATQQQVDAWQAAAPANSGVLHPAAARALGAPAYAAATAGGLNGVGAGSSLLRLSPTGGLPVAQTLPLAARPTFLAAGDLDGNGTADLAALQAGSDRLALARGSASGALGAPELLPAAPGAEALLAGDLNGDCRDDLAYTTAGAADGSLRVIPQWPNGAPGLPLSAAFRNGGATDLATGDLDGDGLPELAALRGTGGQTAHIGLYGLRGRALTALGARRAVDGGFAAHAVAVGDLTGDGRADLVVSAGGNEPNALINIFPQRAGGLLATTPLTLTAWHLPEAVAVADLNHDGRNDLAALHSGWMALTLYLGQAGGTLAPPETYPLPYSAAYRPETLALGDLDGDGGLDVLIADGARGLTYLLNQGGAPTATITAPAACAFAGGSLTLRGTVAGGDALEVSLDGGATWRAVAVSGPSWRYTTTLSENAYPIVLARARSGARVQSPPAALRLRAASSQSLVFLPLARR